MSRMRRLVCVGRFQPPTLRHVECIGAALGRADEVVVVICGAGEPRTVPNPWLAEERAAMLRACFPAAGRRLEILALRDVRYDDLRWAGALRARVAVQPGEEIGFMACGRRDTAEHAALFPDWEAVTAPASCGPDEDFALALFDADALPASLATRLPAPLREAVRRDMTTPAFRDLAAEWACVEASREAWKAAPFPPIFVTVDTVVTHREAVLLITRGRRPGLGLQALPGGFIDPDETLFESALRELAEETAIALEPRQLADALVANRVFDAPYRALRARTITHAFRFDLPAGCERPGVTGGDDAAAAHWTSFSEVDSREMFEDHYAILQVMIGLD